MYNHPTQIKFYKNTKTAIKPTPANENASGFDLYSDEYFNLHPGKIQIVTTGIHIELPENYEAQIRSRSGLAANYGIFVLNSPGTIDQDYTGEIKLIMCNLGEDEYEINVGNRIAQMVICPVKYASQWDMIEVSQFMDLKSTHRSANGIGSTGV